MERLWQETGFAICPSRHPGRSLRDLARRAYLHAVETALGHPAGRHGRVPGLLRHEDTLACRESGAPIRGFQEVTHRSAAPYNGPRAVPLLRVLRLTGRGGERTLSHVDGRDLVPDAGTPGGKPRR